MNSGDSDSNVLELLLGVRMTSSAAYIRPLAPLLPN